MCGCLVLAKADQGRCKVGQATQEMGKGEEGEVVLFACLLSHKANNWMFGVFMCLCAGEFETEQEVLLGGSPKGRQVCQHGQRNAFNGPT